MITDEELENLGDFINAVRSHEEVILLLTNIGETHYSAQEINEMLEPFYKEEQQRRKSVTDEEVQVQGWIPVSEYKGYGIYVPVLQRSEDGEYYEEFAYYDNQRKSWAIEDDCEGPILIDDVTHYFNLPEPPKGEQP